MLWAAGTGIFPASIRMYIIIGIGFIIIWIVGVRRNCKPRWQPSSWCCCLCTVRLFASLGYKSNQNRLHKTANSSTKTTSHCPHRKKATTSTLSMASNSSTCKLAPASRHLPPATCVDWFFIPFARTHTHTHTLLHTSRQRQRNDASYVVDPATQRRCARRAQAGAEATRNWQFVFLITTNWGRVCAAFEHLNWRRRSRVSKKQ